MSSNLVWTPVPKDKQDLSDKLKFVMRKRYDGNVDTVLDRSHLSYLEGLSHAGVEDADKLIAAIQEWGQVHVWEEY